MGGRSLRLLSPSSLECLRDSLVSGNMVFNMCYVVIVSPQFPIVFLMVLISVILPILICNSQSVITVIWFTMVSDYLRGRIAIYDFFVIGSRSWLCSLWSLSLIMISVLFERMHCNLGLVISIVICKIWINQERSFLDVLLPPWRFVVFPSIFWGFGVTCLFSLIPNTDFLDLDEDLTFV